jgi:hypothetical protein
MIPLLPIIISGGKIVAQVIAGRVAEKAVDKLEEHKDKPINYIKKKQQDRKIKQLAKEWIKEIDKKD